VSLEPVSPEDWDALLAELGCADTYLQREYVTAAAVLEPGEPTLLHLADSGGDVVLALILRTVPGSELGDVITPYGYGGAVAIGEDPPAKRFHELYEEWCRERGAVSTFVRFHPLFANHRYAGPRLHLAYGGPTIGWPLADRERLLAGMDGKHRNSCRKALRSGVRVEAARAPADVSGFVGLYESTMRRREAADFYFFPPRYWEQLTRLGDRLVRFDALLEGEVVASALCLVGERWLHYHLAATRDEARALGASNLLLLKAAGWGWKQGLETFHLGGGAGTREDSLFGFKRRFTAEPALEFWVGRAVHDEHAYRRLTGEAEISWDGFFPAYRVPGALSHTAGTPRSR
jgi:Acetyltransferase (GNAT) domain